MSLLEIVCLFSIMSMRLRGNSCGGANPLLRGDMLASCSLLSSMLTWCSMLRFDVWPSSLSMDSEPSKMPTRAPRCYPFFYVVVSLCEVSSKFDKLELDPRAENLEAPKSLCGVTLKSETFVEC